MKDNSIQNIEENTETNNNNSSFDFENNNDNNDERIYNNFYNSRNSFSSLSSNSHNISTFTTMSKNSNYSRRNSEVRRNKIRYIFCIKCKNFYKINFWNNIINFECECMIINNCPINYFISNYTISDKEEVEKNIFCKIHHKQYSTYCLDCKIDLCDDCLQETKKYNNIEMIIKKHETHLAIKLEENINKEIKNIQSSLKIIKGNLPEGYFDFRRIFNLIKDIIIYNRNYYCYNIYQSFANFSNYLSNFLSTVKFMKIKKKIKITSIKEIKDNINKDDPIISIKIINQNYSDISDFKKLNLELLSELNLNENGIEDIIPLKDCNLENLQIFDIENNNLNNKCIDILKNLPLKNIKWLNLFQNKITRTEILDIVQNFKTLESYFIGENMFDKSELEKDRIYNFPPNLKEFGITGNLTDETISFILKLRIEKLKIFYISRNQLSSLSILKYIKFEKLEEFWASFNNLENLKEIENLQSKETIKIINLKKNNIKDISNIWEIIKLFPKLQKLNLENNPINCIDIENIKENLKNNRIELII